TNILKKKKVKAQKNQGVDKFIVEEDIGNKNQPSSGCVAKLGHLQDECPPPMYPWLSLVGGTQGKKGCQSGRRNDPSGWGQEESDQGVSQRDRFGFLGINRTTTWVEIQSLVEILLTPEETRMVKGTIDNALQKHHARNQDWTRLLQEPDWEPRSIRLQSCQTLVLLGLKWVVSRVGSLGRVCQVQQRRDENPGEILECICQAFGQWIPRLRRIGEWSM
ncbi:hypothetical protein E2320_016639, partial [Naja naja]